MNPTVFLLKKMGMIGLKNSVSGTQWVPGFEIIAGAALEVLSTDQSSGTHL